MKNNTALFLIIFVVSHLSAAQQFGEPTSGGIIGNGHFTEYFNPMIPVTLSYPKTWNVLEFGNGISFMEDISSSNNGSHLSINVEEIPSITDMTDLKLHLSTRKPDNRWIPIIIDHRSGLSSITKNEGSLYFLHGPSQVVSIRYRSGSEAHSLEELGEILNTISINNEDPK